MIIRDATSRDRDAIYGVVAAAFGRPAEALLVRRLQNDGDAVIALVAAEDRKVVGHVLMSRMVAPFPVLALAPVSVLPERQSDGIGSALIGEALSRATRGHWLAVFVLGDSKYYGRFGFSCALAAGFESPYAGDHFMVLALTDALPATTGSLRHAPAFQAID